MTVLNMSHEMVLACSGCSASHRQNHQKCQCFWKKTIIRNHVEL